MENFKKNFGYAKKIAEISKKILLLKKEGKNVTEKLLAELRTMSCNLTRGGGENNGK